MAECVPLPMASSSAVFSVKGIVTLRSRFSASGRTFVPSGARKRSANPAARNSSRTAGAAIGCTYLRSGSIPRVVTLEDGETVLNAFPDRNSKK